MLFKLFKANIFSKITVDCVCDSSQCKYFENVVLTQFNSVIELNLILETLSNEMVLGHHL